MRGDASSRSSYYQSGIQNGWLTRNEARIAENLNPINGLDQPLRPLNMVEEDAAENLELNADVPIKKSIAKPSQDDEAEISEQTKTNRFDCLVQSSAERIARRICRSGHLADKDTLLISQALAVPLERVKLWAETQRSEPLDQKNLTQSLISLGMNL
jgi:hypothetical protein